MPAVFIHGVPDTYRVWDQVFDHLPGHTLTALALPGFGTPIPEGFTATKEQYVAWIILQLEALGTPVDLVGHDWGCIFAVRVASLRPDLVRTWAAGSGPVSHDYQWHELAKVWQTPVAGERWMAEMDPPRFSHLLEQLGVPANLSSQAAGRVDGTMKDCILRLYRSAVHVGGEWEAGLAEITAPGLVFWGKDDIACPIHYADALALGTRASRVLKLDCAHWTPLARPAEIAAALERHWSSANARHA